jgi:hypothetical protein
MFKVSEFVDKYRVIHPIFNDMGNEQNGLFRLQHRGFTIMCSSGMGWEHVSVSRRDRIPTYKEMCWVKSQFWGDDDVVMQLHVAKAEHVNFHERCLHLWRPIDQTIPTPPSIFVGPKELSK